MTQKNDAHQRAMILDEDTPLENLPLLGMVEGITAVDLRNGASTELLIAFGMDQVDLNQALDQLEEEKREVEERWAQRLAREGRFF